MNLHAAWPQAVRRVPTRRDVARVALPGAAQVLVVYAAVRAVAWTLLALVPGGGSVLRRAADWDGGRYLAVAAHGYPASVIHNGTNLAFFPGWPLLLRAAHLVGPDWELDGFVLSLVMGAAACVLATVVVGDLAGPGAGRRAGVLLAAAPGAYLFGMDYAEAQAVALALGALVLLNRRRWVAAGAVAALAGATSPLALPLLGACAWVAWTARDRRAWAAPVLGVAGPLSFELYFRVHTGSWFTWFEAQRLGWAQHVDPATPLTWLARHDWISVTEVACLVLAGIGLWTMRRVHVPAPWWIVTVPVLLAGCFDSGSWVDPRLLLDAFPLTLAAAVGLEGRRYRTIAALSAAASVLILVLYAGNTLGQP
jgi:hypothetical protein